MKEKARAAATATTYCTRKRLEEILQQSDKRGEEKKETRGNKWKKDKHRLRLQVERRTDICEGGRGGGEGRERNSTTEKKEEFPDVIFAAAPRLATSLLYGRRRSPSS